MDELRRDIAARSVGNAHAHCPESSFRQSLGIVRKQTENRWLVNTGKQRCEPLTRDERQACKHVFSLLDVDCGGTLDVDELMLAMQALGVPVPRSVLYEQIERVAGKNQLNFQDFLGFMTAETSRQRNNSPRVRMHRKDDSSRTSHRRRRGSSPLAGKKADKSWSKKPRDDGTTKQRKRTNNLPLKLFIPAYIRRENINIVMSLDFLDDVEDALITTQQDRTTTATTSPQTSAVVKCVRRSAQEPELCLQRDAKAGRPARLVHVSVHTD
jgi:hypothetical protein